jgi:hypothetical protein
MLSSELTTQTTKLGELTAKFLALQKEVAAQPKPVYSYCKDAHTLASSNGQTWACDPYNCQGTACLKQCGQVTDCMSPFVCDSGGACVKAP